MISAAPSGPPTSFHVVVLNSTAVEVLYNLPQFEVRNGIIRGFKIFAEQADGSGNEFVYNVTDNTTLSYIAGGLKPATAYIFSILAYTVADGPRSIHLTAITNALGKRYGHSVELYARTSTCSNIYTSSTNAIIM